MHIDNRTGWPFAPIAGRLGWPKHSLTAVLKATWRLVPDGTAEPAEEPLPLEADVHADGDDPAVDAPRYESDLAEFKPRADLLLVGRAHAPGGRPARQFRVAFQVGNTRKELRVSGDRSWVPGLLRTGVTDPQAVRTVELSYRNSFGGPGFAPNPVGKGLAGDPAKLPNLEDPADPVTSTRSRPAPAGFGPLSRTWQPRAGRIGSFDAEWFHTRSPWYPKDRDWTCANAAPADLQVEGYLRGDETAILEGLHPGQERIECRLPGAGPRFFALRGDGRFDEAPLRLDTLWIDAETLTLALVWRGVLEVATDDFSDLSRIFILPDACGAAARPADAWRAELLAAGPGAAASAEDAAAGEPGVEATGTEAAADDAADRGGAPDDEEPDPELPEAPAPPTDEELLTAVLTLKSAGVADLDPTELLDEPPEEPAVDEAPAPSPWTATAVVEAAASGESLAGKNLSGLDLSGATLDGADLEGADLSGARLDRASVRGVLLVGATLAGASAIETCFDGSWLAGADLTDAVLERASLTGADLSGTRLERARFIEAALDGADLREAGATGASFEAASLRGAMLDAADAPAVNFVGADLTDASLVGATVTEADFEGATLPASSWADASARGARFVYAEGSEADFTGADLEGADLARSNFRRACFRKAKLAGARLREANLFQALFVYAGLDGADARGANLYGAELADATHRGLRVDGADLTRSKLDPRPRVP